MAEDRIDAVVDAIMDRLNPAFDRGDRCLIIVRCVGPSEVDHARQRLMREAARFAWRTLPVAELSPPDLLGAALQAGTPTSPVLLAYDLPMDRDHHLVNGFVERLKVAERSYVMGPFRMVLLTTMKELRDITDRAPQFAKSRDALVAWPVRSGSASQFLPALASKGNPSVLKNALHKNLGGLADSFSAPVAAAATSVHHTQGLSADRTDLSTDQNMPTQGPWAGAPYSGDDEDLPPYIANADAPAGRRWGKDLAPEDPEAASMLDRCRTLLDQRHTEFARQGLARVAKHFRSTSNGPATAEAYVMLGRASDMRFDHQSALEWYEQAFQVYSALQDAAGLSDTCAMIGYLRFMHGDLDGAFTFFDRGLRQDEEAEDELRMSAGYRRVGIILEERQELAKAQVLYQRAAEIEEKNNDRFAHARSLHHLARVAQRAENFDEAAELLEQSLELKEALDDRAGLATGYHELGNLKLCMVEYHAAQEAYERAFEIEEAMKDAQGLAVTQAQLGLVHQHMMAYDKAVNAYARARELFHRLQSPYSATVEKALEEVRKQCPPQVYTDAVQAAREAVDVLLQET